LPRAALALFVAYLFITPALLEQVKADSFSAAVAARKFVILFY
jgi:hypothetical protein